MKEKIKKCLIILIIIPTILLCGCDKFKPTCKEVFAVSYYFNDKISCDLFGQSTRTISINDITNSKLNKDLLDSYAKFTLTAKSAEIYHLYIEYIYFKLYTSESSDFEMNVNINLSNCVDENEINIANPSSDSFEKEYSCITKKNNVAIFKIYVNKTIKSATGAVFTLDILNNETYLTDPDTKLRWTIFDFKIYGESRAYNQ